METVAYSSMILVKFAASGKSHYWNCVVLEIPDPCPGRVGTGENSYHENCKTVIMFVHNGYIKIKFTTWGIHGDIIHFHLNSRPESATDMSVKPLVFKKSPDEICCSSWVISQKLWYIYIYMQCSILIKRMADIKRDNPYRDITVTTWVTKEK